MDRFRFPRWIDRLLPVIPLFAGGGAVYMVVLIWYGASPKTTDIGYQPIQPIAYSHELHAGQLGLDCRYCHTTVETAAHAAIPTPATCMNCHFSIQPDGSREIAKLRKYFAEDKPIRWVRVHDLPDFVYFNHSVHINKGIGCTTCHGRIDQMEIVTQRKTLSMAWCLDCHRNPAKHLRPDGVEVTQMDWVNKLTKSGQQELFVDRGIRSREQLQNCSICHR